MGGAFRPAVHHLRSLAPPVPWLASLLVKSYLYVHTADLVASRRFYTETLGLPEIYADDGVVGYQVGSMQFSLAEAAATSGPADWADQLGWDGGTGTTPSWSFEFDAAAFGPVIIRLRGSGAAMWTEEPRWVGYWSFPVRDPQGWTVEVTCRDETAWGTGTST